jgi:RsiW-degrading membrane proteinase PrsW (M82 family)
MLLLLPLALLPLLLGLLLFLRVRRSERLSRRVALSLALLGALAGVAATFVERYVLQFTELSFEVSRVGTTGALLSTFLLAAPLEEGLKVLVVWFPYRRRQIRSARAGLTYAAVAAAGFAAAEAVVTSLAMPSALSALRLALSAPAHVAFAAAWGYALGAAHRHDRWFRIAWLAAMLLHGLYDHILWGRGPGYLVAVVPLLLLMAFGLFMALRTEESSLPPSLVAVEPPSLDVVRAHLKAGEKPLMTRWILLGALVTLGLIVALAALAVVVGNRVGVDFTLADESDVRASGPLVLLGVAVLAAFPAAGYLVARASAAQSLLEPALSAALTLGLLMAMLWLAAPIGVLFALAVAPIALGLACGGAWIGLER